MRRKGLSGSGSREGFSSACIPATWRLVVPWMRVSAHRLSQAFEIGLRLLHRLEAQAAHLLLRVAHARLDLPVGASFRSLPFGFGPRAQGEACGLDCAAGAGR